jgi:hypothetical protein
MSALFSGSSPIFRAGASWSGRLDSGAPAPRVVLSGHARRRIRSHEGSSKAYANRRNRRGLRQELHAHGEDADLTPKLWTEFQTV